VPTNESATLRTGQKPCEEGYNCENGVRSECPEGRVCMKDTLIQLASKGGELQDLNVTSLQRCSDGKYVYNGNCITCPEEGGDCRDGKLYLKDNYWFDPKHGSFGTFWGKRESGEIDDANLVYRCSKDACVSNNRSVPECAEGRYGTLCGVCIDGYFGTNNLECKKCPTGPPGIQVGVLLAIFVLLAAAVFKVSQSIDRHHPRLAKSMREKLPEVLKLLTGTFQILGAFVAMLYRVPWPPAFQKFAAFFNIMNLDLMAFPSIRCSSYGKTFFKRFDLHMSVMCSLTLMFLLLLGYVYSKHNARRSRPIPRSLVWNTFLPYLFVIYPSVSKTVILMLRCRTVNGVDYLLSDIALSCETDEYARYRLMSILGVIAFPVGIVAFFTLILGYQKKKLPPDWWPAEEPQKAKAEYAEYRKEHGRSMAKPFAAWKIDIWDEKMASHVKFYRRFGFLFAAYTTKFWWFESLITVYKLGMTTVMMFVSDKDEAKILFGMFGATAMMSAMAFFQPFKHSGILSLNTLAQFVILMVLFTASYMHLNDGGGTFLAVMLILLTISPLVAGVYLVFQLPAEAFARDCDEALFDVTKMLTSKIGKKKKVSAPRSLRDKQRQAAALKDSSFGSSGGGSAKQFAMSIISKLSRSSKSLPPAGSGRSGASAREDEGDGVMHDGVEFSVLGMAVSGVGPMDLGKGGAGDSGRSHNLTRDESRWIDVNPLHGAAFENFDPPPAISLGMLNPVHNEPDADAGFDMRDSSLSFEDPPSGTV